jgi:hypothetical protein
MREEDEPSLPDGTISFGNRAGTISRSVPTGTGLDHQCFENLPEGDYTISIAIPKGYNSTDRTYYELTLKGGDQTYLNFGAQANSDTQANEPEIPPKEGERSPILGIIGAVFLLLGVGVAVFAARLLRSG